MTRMQLVRAALAVLVALAVLAGCSGGTRVTTTVQRDLPNGITVIVKENRASEVVALQLWVRDGGLFETAQEAGSAKLLQLMMFDETEGREPGDLVREFESLGGNVSANIRHDFVQYAAIAPSAHFDAMVDLLTEGLKHPVFSEDRFETRKEQLLEDFKAMQTRPVDRAYRLCLSEIMDGHPYGRLPEGSPETVQTLTVDDVRRRFDERYVGSNMLVSVAGNVNPTYAADSIADALSWVKKGVVAEPAAPPVTWPTESRRVVRKTDVPRPSQVIAFPGPSVLDEDNISMDVLLVILMEGRSSRLNTRLKEELGLVHSIGAGWYTQFHPSPLFVWMELDEENAQKAEDAVVELFQEVADEPVAEDELDKAKTQLKVGNLRFVETADMQAFHNAYWTLIGGKEFADTYVERLGQVTAEEVQRAAGRYLASGVHVSALVVPE